MLLIPDRWARNYGATGFLFGLVYSPFAAVVLRPLYAFLMLIDRVITGLNNSVAYGNVGEPTYTSRCFPRSHTVDPFLIGEGEARTQAAHTSRTHKSHTSRTQVAHKSHTSRAHKSHTSRTHTSSRIANLSLVTSLPPSSFGTTRHIPIATHQCVCFPKCFPIGKKKKKRASPPIWFISSSENTASLVLAMPGLFQAHSTFPYAHESALFLVVFARPLLGTAGSEARRSGPAGEQANVSHKNKTKASRTHVFSACRKPHPPAHPPAHSPAHSP